MGWIFVGLGLEVTDLPRGSASKASMPFLSVERERVTSASPGWGSMLSAAARWRSRRESLRWSARRKSCEGLDIVSRMGRLWWIGLG